MTAPEKFDSHNAMPLALPSHAKKRLQLSFGGFSTKGVKPENQDAFAAHLPSGGARDLKGGVACIADGVSCSDKAQQASQTAVTTFIDDYFSTPDTWTVKTSAARVLSALNAWLYHHGRQSGVRQDSLVTTFSSLICKSNTAHLFHVGDSRIYRFREGDLQQFTRDHCARQGRDNIFLTRALGMDSHLEVDYCQEELQQGDLWLLTTDGVHDRLSVTELKARLTQSGESVASLTSDSLEELAKSIVMLAEKRGSEDNLSCLLLRVDSLPLEDINEVHRKLTQLAIPPVMERGMKLDGYEVLRVIHSGTRSHLYLVKHPDDNQKLVLKTPSENFAEDPQYLEGFIREYWVGSRVNHQGVMKVFPRAEESPFLYHLCEYIEGQTLRQWMYDNPNPDIEKVRNITRDLIQSLRALQRLGMTHRDLKPENVMIDPDGHIKLIDFGTVQVSGLKEITSPLGEDCPVGSVDYIAPEYLIEQSGSYRSDLFSLGVIVYEMLTGALPFNMSNTHRRIPKQFAEWRYRSALDVRPDLPSWLDLALEKAAAPNPGRRYAAMSEFYRDLCVPNQTMVDAREKAPLLERNPLRFWQLVAAVLFIIVVVQALR